MESVTDLTASRLRISDRSAGYHRDNNSTVMNRPSNNEQHPDRQLWRVDHVGGRFWANVRFSNRPFGVKYFQTIYQGNVDIAPGLALFFGTAPSPFSMGFENWPWGPLGSATS
jgi:hypothetical protein